MAATEFRPRSATRYNLREHARKTASAAPSDYTCRMFESSPLSRRSVTLGLACCPLLAARPEAWPAPPDLQAALHALNLPFAPAQLDVIRALQERRAGVYVMEAVVRLTWAPGMRQHKFVAQGPSAEQALKTLVAEIHDTFAALR